ncbi:MAG: UvrD-helicase domain-containing protein [Candidatus Cloacimonetes bacterium]|nr:UvrD-helicase domain-containing protein [Candidatus Cloacimonadota bacterium]
MYCSNKLIIASAGSGKTEHIVTESKSTKNKVLLLTYTLSNEDEIKKRFFYKYGCIPSNITIQTWFSFLIQHWVKPYQGSMHDELFVKNIRGMLFTNQQSAIRYQGRKGPVYWKEEETFKHYFTSDMRLFSDKVAKFAVKCNQKSSNATINRLSKLYDNIFIDEVQDLAGWDLEVLKILFSSNIKVLLVGDPRQVTYLTHVDRKYRKYNYGKIKDFVENELSSSITCELDEESLINSHRCVEQICSFSSKLYPDLQTTCSCSNYQETEHIGLFFVNQNDIQYYLDKYQPIQLRWNRNTCCCELSAIYNFGESKGHTFNRVLIYPTSKMIEWIENNSTSLKEETRAKFYVAITRARYSVAFVLPDSKEINTDSIELWKANKE